jgi:Divergent InlB B-repeat domain
MMAARCVSWTLLSGSWPRRLALALVLGCVSLGAVPALATAAYPVDFAAAQSIGDATNTINGVSCPSVSFCAAVDAQGYALVTSTPAVASSWQRAYLPSGPPLSAISCPSASFCVAVDTTGNAFVSSDPLGATPASWSEKTQIAGNGHALESVSCPSSSTCVAASPDNGLLVSNDGGSSWAVVSGTAPAAPASVSCPSTALCVAIANSREALTLTNLAAGAGATVVPDSTADSQITDNFEAVACATTSLCVAVDSMAYAAASTSPATPTWATAVETGSSSTLQAVACPLSTMCVAVDSDGYATFTTDAGDGASASWSTDETGFDNGHALESVSCPQSGYCVAVDDYGNATIGTGATLQVALSGAGGGTVSDSDSYISCGSSCSADYAAGSAVTLTATPGPDSTFGGWSGGGCSASATCTVTNGLPGSSQSVTATFDPPPPDTTITKTRVNRHKRQATFEFTATNSPTSFECALVKRPKKTRRHKHPKLPSPHYKTCSSPARYRHLKRHARYVFYVYAIGSGGSDATPATKHFKLR